MKYDIISFGSFALLFYLPYVCVFFYSFDVNSVFRGSGRVIIVDRIVDGRLLVKRSVSYGRGKRVMLFVSASLPIIIFDMSHVYF